MLDLARSWWVLVVRGVAAIVFGILAFVWPDIAVEALVVLFGAYALVDGVFTVVAGVRSAQRKATWWHLLLEGLAGVGVGVATFVWPEITARALLLLIAAWAILTGVLEVAAAVRLRREIEGEVLLAIAGAGSIAFGALVFLFPGAGALAVVWVIAAYALLFGILLVALGIRLRAAHHARPDAT